MKNFLIIACMMITSFVYGQNSILKKAKYEDVKYDKYHGWDKVSPTPEEIIVLNEYKTSIEAKLYQLRKHNKTRCFYDTLPDEVQALEYVKALKHKDGTVPVFKLLISNNQNQIDNRKKSNLSTVRNIVNNTMSDTSNLPLEYSNYITNISDVNVTASQYYEDPYTILDTLSICTKDWAKYFREYECFNYDDFGSHKNMIFRFFVKSDGSVTYVDAINNIGCSKTSDCYKEIQSWALVVVDRYDFKPALKNGKSIDSYTNVVVCLAIGDCNTKTNKTRRKQ